jgi:TRAP-type C4-dicarboxylate transport system permease small subunit
MKQFEHWIWRLLDATIFIAVIGLVTLIALQVCSRLLGGSLAWTEELSRFLFIWTIWLGMATGFRQDRHPSISFIFDNCPPRLQLLLRLLQVAAAVIFFSIVCWYGVSLIQQQIRSGEASATLQLGMWLTTVPIVLGSALAILGTLMHALYPIRQDQLVTSVREGMS